MKSTIEKISALTAIATLVAGLAVADIHILSVSGIVRVTPPGSVNFSQAVRGMVLPEGAEVVTTQTGKVQIEVAPGNIVSLRSNTDIKISSAKPRASGFQLLAGRLKGVFSRMASDERFEVNFSNSGAVASVKGTTLTAEQGPDGYSLNTIFGEVELKNQGTSVFIPQGTGWNGVKLEALTDQEINDALNETTDPGTARHRGELHTFANDINKTNDVVRDTIDKNRENDFSVGRTLKDVHGNIARVQQLLFRPNNQTIEFVNLVQRDSYNYAGKFSYNGSHGPRLDYFEADASFNTALPDSLGDWPSFFSSHKDIKLETVNTTLANGPVRDPNRDVLTRSYDVANSNNQTSQPTTMMFNGVPITQDVNAVSTKQDGGSDLWATNITSWNSGSVFMRTEAYAIDQNGKVLSLDSIITNGSQDPIGYVKTLAGEGIISIVDANGNDLMHRGNIDLIVIPDIAIAIATKYAPSLGSINTSGN